MDVAQPSPQPIPAPLDPAQQRTERHLSMLAELGALGMDLARALHRRAMRETEEAPAGPPSDAPADPPADPALPFARVARAVRQIIALESRLAEAREAQQEKRQAAQAHEAAEAARNAIAWRKKQIRRRILPALETDDVGRGARLLCDLEARLDDDAAEPDQLPLAEAVIRICRDLGISPKRIRRLFSADGTQPDEAAGPHEAGPDEGEAMAPAATTPQAAPLGAASPAASPGAPPWPRPVDLLASRGAVSGAGPP